MSDDKEVDAMQAHIEASLKRKAEVDAMPGPDRPYGHGGERAEDYLNFVKPTYIENWPQVLARLSIAQSGFPLTAQQQTALPYCVEKLMGTPRPADLEATIQDISDEILARAKYFPNGSFIRLGSRSPKDAAWSPAEMYFLPGRSPVELLGQSERVWEDVRLANAAGYQVWIWVREWIQMPEWSEFRCFVRNGKLIGISQYQPGESYPEIIDDPSFIAWGIHRFFRGSVLPALNEDLQNSIVDVFVKKNTRGNERQIEVKLLEVNPFGPYTYPGLYDWSKDDFDGRLRFLGESGRTFGIMLDGSLTTPVEVPS